LALIAGAKSAMVNQLIDISSRVTAITRGPPPVWGDRAMATSKA
jgi:hypothetical protein